MNPSISFIGIQKAIGVNSVTSKTHTRVVKINRHRSHRWPLGEKMLWIAAPAEGGSQVLYLPPHILNIIFFWAKLNSLPFFADLGDSIQSATSV